MFIVKSRTRSQRGGRTFFSMSFFLHSLCHLWPLVIPFNIKLETKGKTMLHLKAEPIDLKLTTPFRISRGVQNTAANVIVELTHNEYTGYGEAAPSKYYG